MKIGILGGAFDPPHFGHYLIAVQTMEVMSLDKVIFVPCFSHPFQKEMLPSKHRLNMTKILVENKFKVSDFEIKNNNVSYSINTLDYFSRSNPKNKYYCIIGSDQIETFTRWNNWEKIIINYSLIIFPRSTEIDTIKTKIKKMFKNNLSKKINLIENKEMAITNISSSLIRERVRYGKSISGFVPKNIEDYIKINNLYVTDNSKYIA